MARRLLCGAFALAALVTGGCSHGSVSIGIGGGSTYSGIFGQTSAESAFNPTVGDDDLLLKDDANLDPVDSLTPGQVSDDVSVLLYALTHGYVGRNHLPEEAFRSTISKLTKIRQAREDKHSSQSLCAAIGDALRGIPDSQLTTSLPRTEGCAPGTQAAPSAAPPGAEKPWSFATRSLAKKNVVVAVVRAFPHEEDPAWSEFLETLERAWHTSSGLILDLRGINAGDGMMGRLLASKLIGYEAAPPAGAAYISQTPASLALRINEFRLKASAADKLKAVEEQYSLAKKGDVAGEAIEDYPGPPNKPVEFAKPISILIDNGCSGVCESTLELFQGYSALRTYGENTGGQVQFQDPGQLVLPHSRIAVRLSTRFFKYADGRFVEKVGYPPTIHVAKDKDPLKIALDDLAGWMRK